MQLGHPQVPAWLEEGLSELGQFLVRATQRYSLRAVDIDQPALVIPLHGTKLFTEGGTTAEVGVGQYLMLHRALRGTVQNVPGQGDYRAACIPLPWRVIGLARSLLDAHAVPPAPGPNHSHGLLDTLYPELRQLLMVLHGEPADEAALDHALLGVLLALHRAGDSQFRLAQDLSVAARIRLLVAGAPQRAWCSADFEAHLHMSGATLRRRLADEATSLRTVLRDARLHHGLALLQTTRRPLRSIAAACGYRSLPSFCRQFAARFGVEPLAIGGAD